MAVPAKRVPGRGACMFSVYRLRASETGEAVSVPGGADRTIHAYGNWHGATLTLEGSLAIEVKEPSPGVYVAGEDPDQVTEFFGLTDARENPISMTDDDGAAITEAVYWIRPVVTGGNSGGTTDITVVIMHRAT